MIFQPDLVRQIRSGRKTMTRRLTNGAPTCRYQPGKTYAVQPGRGQPATCRIYVTDVHQSTAGAIPLTDAVCEGFRTTDEFKAYWISLHDKKWLEGEKQMLEEADNDDDVILDHDVWIARRSVHMFNRDHAHRPVWVISFHLDATQQPRLLALRSDEIYTTNPARAMSHEPEAVDEDTQKRITRDAGTITQQWQTIEQAHRDRSRALLSREDQLARLQRSARLRAVDISRETWALQNMLDKSTPDAFDKKVRKVEERVFRAAA